MKNRIVCTKSRRRSSCKAERRDLQEHWRTKIQKFISGLIYPGLTPMASVNTRFEGLESVAIAAAAGINERPTHLLFLVEVEPFGGARRTGPAVDRLFTDRCIITTKLVTPSPMDHPR